MSKWIKTNFKGVRYREHPTRKHGIQKDKYFSIRYKLDGKDKEEALGWASDGWTAEKAALELSKLRHNQQSGDGAFTLEEKREVELAKREKEAQEKALAEKASKPFSEIWGEYLAQCKIDGKKSCAREGSLYTHWISPVIGDKPLGEIASIHLEKIKANMGKAELSPRSIRYSLEVVRQVFNFAIRRGHYDGVNPTQHVKKPSCDNRRMRFFTHEEANLILEGLKGKSRDSWLITLISLHCGLRFSEIARLTFGDIDIERNTLWVRDPKNTRSRFAYMTEDVKGALLEMEIKGKNDLIFPSRSGGQREAMSNVFDHVVDDLKLNEGVTDDRMKVVFHTCRHSFASWLVEQGTDLLTVKELMGHKSLAMTERYSHLSPNGLRKAAEDLGKRLASAKASAQDNVVPFQKAKE
jgi:integrase